MKYGSNAINDYFIILLHYVIIHDTFKTWLTIYPVHFNEN